MGLQASLFPDEPLDIIIDRRNRSSGAVRAGEDDRRRRPQVDAALEADGFAIVPASLDQTEDEPGLPQPVVAVPTDEEEPIDNVSTFRQRAGTLMTRLLAVLIGMMATALVLLVLGQTGLITQLFSGPPPVAQGTLTDKTNESFASAQLPIAEEPTPPLARAQTAPPARSESKPSLPDVAASTKSKSMSPSNAVRTERPPKVINHVDAVDTARSKAATDQIERDERSRLSGRGSPRTPSPSNHVASAPSPQAPKQDVAPPQLASAHRAELVRRPVSQGWGDSYAVRLVDDKGQPVVATNVWLVAHMSDGTVQNVAMGALMEPGTYRGTVPTDRSTPVNLQVRVGTGEKVFELPLRAED